MTIMVKGLDDPRDVKLIKQFTRYCLARFLTPYRIKKLTIQIEYVDRDEVEPEDKADLSKYHAWMMPSSDTKDYYFITLAKFAINKRAIKPLKRYKKTLQYLAHELVHIKQYVLGEMRDLYRGEEIIGTRFMGTDYFGLTPKKAAGPFASEWAYYDSPWELEAYGRTDGLYNMFHDEHGKPWLKIPKT
jgi:hypothetical protein